MKKKCAIFFKFFLSFYSINLKFQLSFSSLKKRDFFKNFDARPELQNFLISCFILHHDRPRIRHGIKSNSFQRPFLPSQDNHHPFLSEDGIIGYFQIDIFQCFQCFLIINQEILSSFLVIFFRTPVD